VQLHIGESIRPVAAFWYLTKHRGYGFRARAEPVIGPRFARTRWRAPE
jgi:hypothetical protein